MNAKEDFQKGAKLFVIENIQQYVNFVNQVIKDTQFKQCINALLPFDGMTSAALNLPWTSGTSLKLGLLIMRMDIKPALFSIGISIAIGKNAVLEQDFEASIFITACKTLEEVNAYIQTDEFKNNALYYFEKQLDQLFNEFT